MFWLRCCPRCNGDLYEEIDRYGSYITCLQCGHHLTEADEVVLRPSGEGLRDSSRDERRACSNASAVTSKTRDLSEGIGVTVPELNGPSAEGRASVQVR